MTAYDALLAARILAEHGLNSDSATRADIDAAADLAGVSRPDAAGDRDAVRVALDAISG